MSYTCVPVSIRPHLVKFLIEQFPAHKEAQYCGKKVKSVKIKTNSPLGKYIRSMCLKTDFPEKVSSYNFFFSVEETCSKGNVYAFKNGKYNFLKFPGEFVEDLNEMLEEIFRMNFYYFVEGYKMTGQYGSRKEAIRLFIDRFELYEYGFNMESMEQTFTRISKDNAQWGVLVQKVK